MALHGTIAVNNAVIGGWSATRQEGLIGPDDFHEYKVEIHMFGEPHLKRRTKGTISHRYSDGALVLARKVLEIAR